jgi:C-terminal processing protease CtpA/Prc
MRDLLKVGDKIIAVDNQDVSHTSAPDVSRIINQRAANPIRKFRILREFFADEFETQQRIARNE